MKKRYFYLLALSLFILTSCHKNVIDIDLSDFEDRIIIEGILTSEYRSGIIKISRVTDIYSYGSNYTAVSGAVVKIKDQTGFEEILQETSSGVYRAYDIQGAPEMTYFLTVEFEGKIYYAESTMPELIEFDQIEVERADSFWGEYGLKCYYQDTPGVKNFARIQIVRNGYREEGAEILYTDKYNDGERIIFDSFETSFHLFDNVTLYVSAIDENNFKYFEVLKNIRSTSEDDDLGVQQLLEYSSFNPNSNISGGALGYFSAQTIRTYHVTIE